MSKYQLENLLNEITGTGRIGTYLATYRELLNKVDELEDKGIRVKKLGRSGDGKVPFEFEIYPGDQDEAFSVYPYKFDPDEEDDMQELPFSIGGKPVAIRVAKELLGQGAMSTAEVRDVEKELKSTGDTMPSGFGESEKKELPKSIADKEKAEIEKDAKKAKGMMEEEEGIGQLYVQPAVQKEIRFHLDAFEKGDIDVDDMIQAIEDIIFGRVPAPGMREGHAMSDNEADLEAGVKGNMDAFTEEVDVDLVKQTVARANNQIVTPGDMAKFILDVIDQIAEKEQDSILNNNQMKIAINALTKVRDASAKKSVEENGHVDDYANEIEEGISKDDIKKALKGTKVEIETYMDSLKRSGDKFDSIEDYVEDFENYVADKSLQEHFNRFMFKKYS